MNITLKPRITGGLLSGPAAKWLGSTALLLTLLTSSASAQVSLCVTEFSVTNSTTDEFTVTSNGTEYTVPNEESVTGILNPENAVYSAISDGLDEVDDDSVAFQVALNILNAANGGSLFVPEGDYCIFHQVVVKDTHEIGNSIAIRGHVPSEQEQGARIFCKNDQGFLQLIHDSITPRITISDIKLIAANGGNSGTAFKIRIGGEEISGSIKSPGVWENGGVKDSRVLTMENVTMRYQTDGDYFTKGLDMGGSIAGEEKNPVVPASGCYRSIIKNCTFIAPFNDDGNFTFKADSGFDASNCYAPVFDTCTVTGAKSGFEMRSNMHVEDSAFRQCIANNCNRGINIWWDAWWKTEDEKLLDKIPTNWIRNCDITAHEFGVFIQNRRLVQIVDNTIRPMTNSVDFVDVKLSNVDLSTVHNNTFIVNAGETPRNPNITVDKNCEDLIVGNNRYGNNSNIPISNIDIEDGAKDIIKY